MPTAIETAARILAHREEFNENKWPKYAEVTERMLIAAHDVDAEILAEIRETVDNADLLAPALDLVNAISSIFERTENS